jgi:hypothetical protein
MRANDPGQCRCPTCDPELFAALAGLGDSDRSYLITVLAGRDPAARSAVLSLASELAEANGGER